MQTRGQVLVVDDELSVRESMKMILNGRFDVQTADSGYSALEIAKKKDFDVVVLDIRMPDLSGIEVLRNLKEMEHSPEVVLVTAYASLETAKDAIKLGAYDYIEKPFSMDNFREVVSKGVERKQKSAQATQLANDFEVVRKQLIQLEKLSSLGRMTSEVIHELATPITGLLGFSEFLLDQECDEIIKNSLRKIRSEAERCQTIIRNILTFARKTEGEKKSVNINEVIAKTIDIKSHQFRLDNIRCNLELDPNLPDTLADFGQIQQVIVNILNNAQDALRKQNPPKIISITTSYDTEHIYIMIANNGPHIPEDILELIFEPFFTTKGSEQGTGLGLSISRDIIRRHNGDIQVYSKSGEGVAFTIYLPLIEQKVEG
ncbi:TPA: response regulator [Candidatus Poribacteria bacterium]|nr:response regulator [Candidatus Poribacteria bacterium]